MFDQFCRHAFIQPGGFFEACKIRIAIAFFGLIFALVGAIQPAGAQPAASLPEKADPVGALGWVLNVGLQNSNSGKCALVRGAADQAPAVQFTCLNFADQRWDLIDNDDDRLFHLVNRNSGKCLLVRGGSDGTQLVQFECASYADQLWSLT